MKQHPDPLVATSAEARARRGVWASLWVFDPTDCVDEPQVEAMPVKIEVSRNDEDRIIVTARGKPGARYEPDDSVWLEMTDADMMKLIEQGAKALHTPMELPPEVSSAALAHRTDARRRETAS